MLRPEDPRFASLVPLAALPSPRFLAMPPTFLALEGNRGTIAEEVVAYEVGFRSQPVDYFSWDVAAFYNRYDNLISLEWGAPRFDPPSVTIPLIFANHLQGRTYGAELSGTYEFSPNFRLYGAYSLLQMDLRADPSANLSGSPEDIEGASPQHQFVTMASWSDRRGRELDLIGRYVDALPALNVGSYISLDARLGWRPNEFWDFSLMGRNLLDSQHLEFRGELGPESEIRRSVYFQVTRRW
jgi:iron complex outermembrane recepter protein